MIKNLARVSAFILVAGSKTIYTAGQACLTVDAAVKAVYCLSRYYDKPGDVSKNVEAFNIMVQVLAASVSTMVVAWSRYPSIWDKLSIQGIKKKYAELSTELGSHRVRIAFFSVIAFFGIFSCVARGLSAYLGAEVIFRERLKIKGVGVDIAAGFIGATAIVSTLCFNFYNMLTDAVKYLKKPRLEFSFKYLFGFVAVLTQAIVTRFLIKEFLDRRGANETSQITLQSFFFIARFMMDSFTMGSSLKDHCWNEAKATLKISSVFSFVMIADAVSTWLGYSSIVLYSILTDVFITKSASNHGGMLCSPDQTHRNFALHCSFVSASLIIGIPSVIAYFNYLLKSNTKAGYDSMVRFFKSPLCCRTSTPDEEQALLSGHGGINIGSHCQD